MSSHLQKYMPRIREEKTESYLDDVKVLIAGVIFCIGLIYIQHWIMKAHDFFLNERPFVTANVSIYDVAYRDEPMIMYDADAIETVRGEWIASLHLARDDSRIATRRGNGTYTAMEDTPNLWTWAGWFDNEIAPAPEIPDEPFYVCIRYDVETVDAQVQDSTPLFCSQTFDPDEPVRLTPNRGFDHVESNNP